jgi:hypothetical protein
MDEADTLLLGSHITRPVLRFGHDKSARGLSDLAFGGDY